MNARRLALLGTGLVTPVGLNAPATCAAIRVGLTNPVATHFLDAEGERITAHSVPLVEPWVGRAKLVKMLALALNECLETVPVEHWHDIPMLLCVAEPERPGRIEGLEDELYAHLEEELNVQFPAGSLIIPHGRGSVATAMQHARKLIDDGHAQRVLIAATDSLLSWPTLAQYEDDTRLLAGENSDGFVPGEAAAALLIGPPTGEPQLLCSGLGFATETATRDSDEPLRGEGLTRAIRAALEDAGCQMHECDLRIADLSGEQYYFKEATLALGRTLRARKEEFDLWHPAECIGEAGAPIGLVMLAVAEAACRKGYAPGSRILLHWADDDGRRAAIVTEFGVG